jgi:LacI family transcriptional regulator
MPSMRSTPHVALLIETSRAYGRGLLRGVTEYVHDRGPWSVYFKPHGLSEPSPAWLTGWQGDGILARIETPELAEAVAATGLPTVDLRGRMQDLGIPFIGVNNRKVSELAASYLLDRGFERFAFCGLPRGQHVHMDQRCDHFREAVERAGHPCDTHPDPQRQAKTANWEQEQDELARWLAALPKRVGVMACHDDRGLQVLDACRRVGLKVPDEVAVISVDNDDYLCGLADPPMTSIDPNPEAAGYEAAKLLDMMMRGGKPASDQTLIDPRGVVARRSTDVLAIDDPHLIRALRYIREHAVEPIDVRDVLRQVPLSRSGLERRFRRMLGRSPKEEITRARLECATQLLSYTKLPIESISHWSGFKSHKHFADVFRRKLGCTPRDYRKAHAISRRM